MEVKKAIIITKPDVRATLLALKRGEQVYIANREIRETSIRRAISVLRKEGYEFICSVSGTQDGVNVTRLN